MARLPKIDQNPAELARFSSDSWRELDSFYTFWTARWQRSLDFIRALHWRTLQELETSQIPEWKRFPVANMTLAFYSDYISQFMKSRVRFTAVPASADAEDVTGAEVADIALRYAWNLLSFDEKKVDIAAWLTATGNADLRIFWNTDTGDMIPLAVPMKGKDGKMQLVPINPDTGQPDPTMSEPKMIDAGEIGIEVVPPQLVRTGIKPSMGKMVGSLYTYDEALIRYGEERAEKLHYAQQGGATAFDLLSVFPAGGATNTQETALVIEHYLPKGNRHPGGLWWTSSNDQIITQPAPLPGRHIPMVHFRWIPLPGHPEMGLTPIYDMTFSNKTYDEMLARILEWLNRVVPKVFRQSGDGLKYGDITDEPFQEIVTNPGLQPVIPAVPGPPEHFFRIKQDVMDDALMTGGYRFQRQADLPAGASQSRRQPATLQGEGETVALALINSKPSWTRTGYILLDYMARFYTEPRVASMIGPDRTLQWQEFSGADLKNMNATLFVDELPLYPFNRQALRDTVLGLMESNAGAMIFAGADGQLDRDRVDAAMSAVGIDVAAETLDPDILEAKNEITMFKMLKEGQEPPQMMPWQDHAQHVAVKTRAMKSLTYRAWSKESQDALLKNVGEHEQALAESEKAGQASMLENEKALRDIRAQAETSKDVRTALGEALVQKFVEITLDTPEKKGKEK